MTNHYTDVCEETIKSLRQQISDLTISSDTYFTERNSARDAWRRVSKERDQLRQQLAAVSDLLKKASGPMSYGNWSSEFRHSVEKALAITPSIFEWQKLVAENAELRQQFAAANTLINKYREETTSLRQQVKLLSDFVTKISEQLPEKPDHWSSCSQCEYNSSDAEEIIEALASTDDLDGLILCDATPIRYLYRYQDAGGQTVWVSDPAWQGMSPLETMPLYRAKEQ